MHGSGSDSTSADEEDDATDPDVFAKFFDVFAKFFDVFVENGAQNVFEI